MSKARIVEKYLIRTVLKTLAPLRIATGQDDGVVDILILKNKRNKAFIPGTSLAGVLRNQVRDIYGAQVADQLFGSVSENEDAGEQSMLNISDVELNGAEIIYRDGVAIDTYRGVGKDGSKYDFELLDAGAEGEILIEMTVRAADKEKLLDAAPVHAEYERDGAIYKDLAATLADLLTGGISVGSLTTKGFGLIAARQEAGVACFDFQEENAFAAWLAYLKKGVLPPSEYSGNPVNLSSSAPSTLKLEAAFALKNSLLIRDYDAAQEINDSAQAGEAKIKLSSVQMMRGDKYIIPGTSIKGILRNRAKKILMYLSGGMDKETDSFLNSLMGFADARAAAKSRLSVQEVYIDREALAKHRHSRNRIDRFTGSTIDGALFTEEPVWQQHKDGAPLRLSISIRDCSEAEAGLALLLLKDLWLGNLSVGGGKSIGRGTLQGKKCRLSFAGGEFVIAEGAGFSVKGDAAKLEGYVAALVRTAKEMAVK